MIYTYVEQVDSDIFQRRLVKDEVCLPSKDSYCALTAGSPFWMRPRPASGTEVSNEVFLSAAADSLICDGCGALTHVGKPLAAASPIDCRSCGLTHTIEVG